GHVGQGIVLLAKCRLRVGKTRHPTVHSVENHGYEDGDSRYFEASVNSLDDRIETRKKIGSGKDVGQQVNAASAPAFFRKVGHVSFLARLNQASGPASGTGSSASTVLVALTLSPMATRGREPFGK